MGVEFLEAGGGVFGEDGDGFGVGVEAFEGGVGDEAGFGGHDLLLTTPRILPQHTQLHSTFLPLLINLHLPKVNRLILPPL